MEKILFVRPVCSTISEPELPLNLLILSACLENVGYEPRILDYDAKKLYNSKLVNFEDGVNLIVNEIIKYAPESVFFTCMCNNFARTISIIKSLKTRQPEIFIGIGGPHVSMCASDTMRAYHEYIDAIIIGEGEKTIVELVRGIEKNNISNVHGICYWYNNKVIITEKRELLCDLDESPIPAYHLINMNDYGNITGKVNVYVGSGCPFACNFCTTSLMWERRYRTKSINRVITELKTLVNEYNKKNFVLIHDNLTANPAYAINLIEEIKKSDLNIEYEISSRIDTIDEDIIRLFSESGGKTIFFGIETGSEKMQNIIGKKLELSRIYNILNLCKKYNVQADTSFIMGFPDESLEDLEKTINLSFACRALLKDNVGMNLLSIYPGSPLSYLSFNDLYLDEINYEFPMYQGLSNDEILDVKKYKSIYINYYLYKNYSTGLTAVETKKMFDYITIILEKYPNTFNYLLNNLKLHFVDIFLKECYTVDKLSLEDKDCYNYFIEEEQFIEDIKDIINPENVEMIKEFLNYDSAIEDTFRASIEKPQQLFYNLFSLNIISHQGNNISEKKYSIVLGKNGEVFDLEIPYEVYCDLKKIEKNALKVDEYIKKIVGIEFNE